MFEKPPQKNTSRFEKIKQALQKPKNFLLMSLLSVSLSTSAQVDTIQQELAPFENVDSNTINALQETGLGEEEAKMLGYYLMDNVIELSGDAFEGIDSLNKLYLKTGNPFTDINSVAVVLFNIPDAYEVFQDSEKIRAIQEIAGDKKLNTDEIVQLISLGIPEVTDVDILNTYKKELGIALELNVLDQNFKRIPLEDIELALKTFSQIPVGAQEDIVREIKQNKTGSRYFIYRILLYNFDYNQEDLTLIHMSQETMKGAIDRYDYENNSTIIDNSLSLLLQKVHEEAVSKQVLKYISNINQEVDIATLMQHMDSSFILSDLAWETTQNKESLGKSVFDFIISQKSFKGSKILNFLLERDKNFFEQMNTMTKEQLSKHIETAVVTDYYQVEKENMETYGILKLLTSYYAIPGSKASKGEWFSNENFLNLSLEIQTELFPDKAPVDITEKEALTILNLTNNFIRIKNTNPDIQPQEVVKITNETLLNNKNYSMTEGTDFVHIADQREERFSGKEIELFTQHSNSYHLASSPWGDDLLHDGDKIRESMLSVTQHSSKYFMYIAAHGSTESISIYNKNDTKFDLTLEELLQTIDPSTSSSEDHGFIFAQSCHAGNILGESKDILPDLVSEQNVSKLPIILAPKEGFITRSSKTTQQDIFGKKYAFKSLGPLLEKASKDGNLTLGEFIKARDSLKEKESGSDFVVSVPILINGHIIYIDF